MDDLKKILHIVERIEANQQADRALAEERHLINEERHLINEERHLVNEERHLVNEERHRVNEERHRVNEERHKKHESEFKKFWEFLNMLFELTRDGFNRQEKLWKVQAYKNMQVEVNRSDVSGLDERVTTLEDKAS